MEVNISSLRHRLRLVLGISCKPVLGIDSGVQWLDGKHTIFGRVKSGMRVVQRMGLVKTGKDDKPIEDVRIIRAYIKEDDSI